MSPWVLLGDHDTKWYLAPNFQFYLLSKTKTMGFRSVIISYWQPAAPTTLTSYAPDASFKEADIHPKSTSAILSVRVPYSSPKWSSVHFLKTKCLSIQSATICCGPLICSNIDIYILRKVLDHNECNFNFKWDSFDKSVFCFDWSFVGIQALSLYTRLVFVPLPESWFCWMVGVRSVHPRALDILVHCLLKGGVRQCPCGRKDPCLSSKHTVLKPFSLQVPDSLGPGSWRGRQR